MKFLFVVKQKKNVDAFEGVLAELLNAGHRVTVAIQDRDEQRDRRLVERFDNARFEVVSCPHRRSDAWRTPAPLIRSVRDWAQYLRPQYRDATKLRQRAVDRLLRELGAEDAVSANALRLDESAAMRLHDALALVEDAMSSDPLYEEFLTHHAPDAVLVTPGLHFGSAQADFIKSARARNIPVWMLLFSWDNLSTKGALHAAPDLMFVWNERQRSEAVELHGFPADRVVVSGAPRFDEFFTLRSTMARTAFLEPLGLDPSRPTLLYLCSSRFIAERELRFIRRWLLAIRGAGATLAHSNVIVRPHPDVPLVADDEPTAVVWRSLPQATGWVQRPFADAAAIVLRTTYSTPQVFFECLHHSEAVVALNTSAELEAGIAGRSVFTVLANDEDADGQRNTLHFSYLLREHGGFVTCAADLASHIQQLGDALTSAPDAGRTRGFIMEFLRPRGDRPVSELLARELLERAGPQESSRATVASPDHILAPPDGAHASEGASVLAYDDPEDAKLQRKRLRIGASDSAATVYATPETRRWRKRGVLLLDPLVVRWLTDDVHPGDVVYDIGAGIGGYTIFAAVQRGALAVAFEPGFAAYKRLCENLLVNDCSRSVIPLPVALGNRTGLLELAYPYEAGSDVHTLFPRRWRSEREAVDARYAQPVCAERLDDLVARHGLPPPTMMRIGVRRGVEAILDGSTNLLRSPRLRSVLVSARDKVQAESVVQATRRYALAPSVTVASGDHGVVVRLDRTGSPGPLKLSRDAIRRTAYRMRRLWQPTL